MRDSHWVETNLMMTDWNTDEHRRELLDEGCLGGWKYVTRCFKLIILIEHIINECVLVFHFYIHKKKWTVLCQIKNMTCVIEPIKSEQVYKWKHDLIG